MHEWAQQKIQDKSLRSWKRTTLNWPTKKTSNKAHGVTPNMGNSIVAMAIMKLNIRSLSKKSWLESKKSNSDTAINNFDVHQNLSSESIVRKIFEGEMWIRTLPTSFLQIFCKIIFLSKIISESSFDPDENSKWNSWAFED